MSKEIDLNSIAEEIKSFVPTFKTAQLATCDSQGKPEASYACYVCVDGKYYIYVSDLAEHAKNLKQVPKCSMLFIENEQDAKQIFARRRLSLLCDSKEVERDSAQFNKVMDLFAERFGNFMKAIRDLVDFHLIELLPVHGSYVSGFAKAFYLEGENLDKVIHRKDEGHKAKTPEAQARIDRFPI